MKLLTTTFKSSLPASERKDCSKSQVCRASIRARPCTHRISPRSSCNEEPFARAFGGSGIRLRAQATQFPSRRTWDATANPRGCALSSVQPCPSLGRVPTSEPGSEDLPERQERRCARRYSTPAHARPRDACVPRLKKPLCARHTLKSVCARVAQAQPRWSFPPSPPASLASFPSSPLPPRRLPSPHRCAL